MDEEVVEVVARMNGAVHDRTASNRASAVTTTSAVVVRFGVGVDVTVCDVGSAGEAWCWCWVL